MAARKITTFECFSSGHFGTTVTYVLCTCLACGLLFIIRRRKNRAQLADTEKSLSDSSLEESSPDHTVPHLEYLAALDQDSPSTKLLDYFSEAAYIQPLPFTSGFLAAKADIENTDFLARASEELVGDNTATRDTNLMVSSVLEDMQVPWRRHSYPLAHDQGGTLHGDAKHDETRYIHDDLDTDVVWRRRTMVFR